jgi:trehalose 6-phosphate synthase/phosphatase
MDLPPARDPLCQCSIIALEPVLRSQGGTWIAWDDRSPGRRRPPPPSDDTSPFSIRLLPLSEPAASNYYHGFSNRVLWPICHGFLDKCRFDHVFFRDYLRCNQEFSRAAVREADRRDVLWVHDYHLALVPGQIRELAPHLKVLLFWHIPFPPAWVFRAIPWAREILEGMLGADLIGFHTREYASHFLESCRVLLGLPVNEAKGEVQLGRRRARIVACPIGADVAGFDALARRQGVLLKAHQLRKSLGVDQIILGVDRLDYTKGILERFLAYEIFLKKHPQHRSRHVLLQVAVPSRTRVQDYVLLRKQIDETAGRLNALYAEGSWIPIRYSYRSISRESLAVLYAAADVALITPLRDGMNLVAKEYVASHTRDDGVLIISELAGAAEELEEALIVNPYDLEAVSDALRRAMDMTLKEKTERMRALRRRVQSRSIHWWVREFLREAGCSLAPPSLRRGAPRPAGFPSEPAAWIQPVGRYGTREAN